MWVPSPDWLGLVQFLFLNLGLLDLLSLLFLFFILLFVFYFFNLGLLLLILLFPFLSFLGILIRDVLLGFFGNMEVDGVGDELRVFLDNFLDLNGTHISPVLVKLYCGRRRKQTLDSLR